MPIFSESSRQTTETRRMMKMRMIMKMTKVLKTELSLARRKHDLFTVRRHLVNFVIIFFDRFNETNKVM